MKKQFLKTKNICKVSFEINADEVKDASTVNLVGDFNDWSESKTELKKFKNGNFKLVVNLEKNKTYQFKYLVDGSTWQNDANSDELQANIYGGDNSVVNTAV